MATGYTCIIEDGDGATFREYLLRCARAFGACIEQREDSLGELPKHREPTGYYTDRIRECEAKLRELQTMTVEQADVLARAEHTAAVLSYAKEARARVAKLRRYDAMLAEVEAWTPPTAQHQGLKDFMRSQIVDSVKFERGYDPPAPVLATGADWLTAALESERQSLGYAVQHHREEVERCTEANAWIDALMTAVPR